MTAVSFDPTLDLLTVVFDDGTVFPEAIEDALYRAGYVVDRVPALPPPSER